MLSLKPVDSVDVHVLVDNVTDNRKTESEARVR